MDAILRSGGVARSKRRALTPVLPRGADDDRVPPLRRLRRLARIATLPETRALARAAASSEGLRALPGRALHDRPGLLRDLRGAGSPRTVLHRAAGHPVTRELANVAFVFLPIRYGPVGWAAKWATGRAVGRYLARHGTAAEPQAPDAPQGEGR